MPSQTVSNHRGALDTNEAVLRRYPRICAHLICESLGYATPTVAASILRAAIHKQQHFCEWLMSCYQCNPVVPVTRAIRYRSHHRGYMSEYETAIRLVREAIQSGNEPIFASWF
ncbi:MAG: hypothetical protein ABSE73_00020 [Planctomycetota bacterium]